MTIRILAISSQVAYGPVGNSAAVPAIETLGITVHQLPTIILSSHLGLGQPEGFRTEARQLAGMLGALDNIGLLSQCAGVMTGFFAANDQIHGVSRMIRKMKEQNPSLFYLCDPVIGDDPKGFYVPLPVAEAIREELVPLADCVTPNRFELEWLSGRAVTSIASAKRAAGDMGRPEVLATSIPAGQGTLATLAITGEHDHEHLTARKDSVPHGTGDLLAGLYLAHRVLKKPPAEALPAAMAVLEKTIDRSEGRLDLDIVRGRL
jgi:pyridoxine kinase